MVHPFPGITPARAGKSKIHAPRSPPLRNYPRSRGEKTPVAVIVCSIPELPPLARGKGAVFDPHPIDRGITPARAGKRCAHAYPPATAQNYPRSRGEKAARTSESVKRSELPPLARGKAGFDQPVSERPGITPARAGKSHSASMWQPGYWNYPRSRGEKFSASSCLVGSPELPPLARGKETTAVPKGTLLGITPARAGKSNRLRRPPALRGNYPRSRGEKNTDQLTSKRSIELPPLARGKEAANLRCVYRAGITPARAGKRCGGVGWGECPWNYPRSRGEKSALMVSASALPELPPLARGKDPAMLGNSGLDGITPARAGKSHHPEPKDSPLRNYPRSRGEKPIGAVGLYVTVELPPLARGKDYPTCRFIGSDPRFPRKPDPELQPRGVALLQKHSSATPWHSKVFRPCR
mgnify:CR=1 FL=1